MYFIKESKIFYFLFFYFSIFLFPLIIHAQSVSLSAPKTSYTIADSIVVTASVDTGKKAINTVSGTVTFLSKSLSLSDLRYGNSIISLWVEKPNVLSGGAINFTGGIPGGFNGNAGPLFTFVVKPKSQGTITIALKDIHVLLNDGSGAELSFVKLIPLTLTITDIKAAPPSLPKAIKEQSPILSKDTTAPENFAPMVSRHPSIGDNAYFVSFNAIDKDTGVAKYEVREEPKIISLFTDSFGTEWKEAKSPYILLYQNWASQVSVKAIDGAGNAAIAFAEKPFSPTVILLFIIILVFLSVIFTRIWTLRASSRLRGRIK